MKKIFLYLTILSLVFIVSCQNDSSEDASPAPKIHRTSLRMENMQDSVNYALGVVIGRQMKKYGIKNIDYKLLMTGIRDATNPRYRMAVEPDIAKKIVSLYATNQLKSKLQKDKNQNIRFLSENAKKADVKILPNGLQYKILKKGRGKSPNLSSFVTVEYTGKLINGDVFVTTEDKHPVNFVVRNSLPGWQSALTRMKKGSEWIIYVPPELAFGKRGTSKVPPNSVVIYKIKLLKIK